MEPSRQSEGLSIERLIEAKVPPYGLAPRKWQAQADQLRELPETRNPPPDLLESGGHE